MRINLLGRIFEGCLSCFRRKENDREEADTIYILSSDYELMRTTEEDVLLSGTFQRQFKLAGERKYAVIYHVENVNADILRLILKYGEYHKGDERRQKHTKERELREGLQLPGPQDYRRDKIKPEPSYWDIRFMDSVKSRMNTLFAASFILDIPELTELILIYHAFMLRGRSAEQIRNMLRIPRDITAEEEAEIKAQSVHLAGDV